MELDARGNVTAMATQEPTRDGASAPDHMDLVWDEHRRLVEYRTEAGAGRYRWNAAGRLTESVDPTGVTTRYDWDERGLLRSATDGAGATSAYGYDIAAG